MVFSSPIFLFLFLPIVLATHFALPRSARNGFLVVASLFFYAWGEARFTPVLLAWIGVNFGFGLWLDAGRGARAGRLALALAVATNVGFLVVFKYASLLADTANAVATG